MTSQAVHVLRAEGVNFGATLFDTHDISTIRGAGLTLLALPTLVQRTLTELGVTDRCDLVTGASLFACAFTLPAGLSAADIRARVETALTQPAPATNDPPFHHLSFVVDIALGGGADGLNRATASNHARQFRQWTLRPPAFSAANTAFDADDRMRPSAGETRRSDSTRDRRAYGRLMRQDFYRRHAQRKDGSLGFTPPRFTDHFQDLVADGPAHLPMSLGSAMAVVYADGNRFGSIRNQVAPAVFSDRILALQRGLLRSVLAWLTQGSEGDGKTAFAVAGPDGGPRLRFETLLWGGDEMMFVMPAWLAFAFVDGFFAATGDWSIPAEKTNEPIRLTNTVGVVICHHKTPIRLARDLVKEVVDGIKEAGRARDPINAIGFEVFESIMPPSDGLSGFRNGLYGPGHDPLSLAFPGDDFAKVWSACRALIGPDGLARSQTYRILRRARAAEGGIAGQEVAENIAVWWDDYRKRVRADAPDTALPRLPHTKPRGQALDLALLARYWDYVDPDIGVDPMALRDCWSAEDVDAETDRTGQNVA